MTNKLSNNKNSTVLKKQYYTKDNKKFELS